MADSAASGPAYRGGLTGLDWYRDGKYLFTDQLGRPVHPEWYSDEFGRLLKRIGLRRITLHDSRHTTLTLIACGRSDLHREQVGAPLRRRIHPGAEGAGPHSKDRLAVVRDCESLSLRRPAWTVSHLVELASGLRRCGALGGTRTPSLLP